MRFASIERAAPFLAVENEAGRIDGAAAPLVGVIMLALRVSFRRERVFPAEVIPVIDMEGDGHKVLPQLRTLLQPGEPRLGGQTTAAPFRGVEFEQRSRSFSALELNGVSAHASRRAHEQGTERKLHGEDRAHVR